MQQLLSTRLEGKAAFADDQAKALAPADDLVALADPKLHPLVIQRHLPLEERSLQALRMMHRPQIAADHQVAKLLGVDRIVLVPVPGNQAVAARIAEDRKSVV